MTALVLALIAGAVVGIALGALGGGGSVLAVPALIYLLGFSPSAATTASLIIVAATSAAALHVHARDGHVTWKVGSLFAAAGIIPAYLAGAAAGRVPEVVLTLAFSVIAGLAAVRMFRPSSSRRPERIRAGRAAGAGAGLGAVTGFLGVGGGFLAVPVLAGVLGLPMRRAAGTSLLVITVNSLAALVARTGTGGSLDWALIGLFTGAAVLGAWGGRRLSVEVSGDSLRRAFAGVLLAVALFMLIDVIA